MKDNTSKNPGDNFLVQGSILAAAGIIVRLIGLLYKIPMTRILGDEGIGYYNTAYEIYNIGLILSSYSLPLALSKLIAAKRIRKEYENTRRVFICGIIFGLVAGGIMTLLLLFEADWITEVIFKSPGSALPLKVMAPTILVFSIMGVFRGFFQGQGNMIPTSVSQIIEQLVNAVVSVLASYLLMRHFADAANPYPYGAAGGTLGTLTGAVAAFLFLSLLMLGYMRTHRRRPNAPGVGTDSYRTAAIALSLTLTPIILSQFIYQLSGTIDNSMFGTIMSAQGLAEKERMTLLGIYSGKYRLLSNVPVAIATSLGASMIPSIVASRMQRKREDVKRKISITIKFNMLIAIPCAAGMGVLARPIMLLVFRDSSDMAAHLMMLGAPAVVFFSLSTVTNAVLQGIDLMRKSVTHSAISLILHIVLVYVMLGQLNWSVYGLVIGNVSFALVVCILNWSAIGRALNYRQEVKTTFLLPVLASAVMSAVAWLVYHGIYLLIPSNTLSLLSAVALAMLTYLVLVFKLHIVTEDELSGMPMGRSLTRLYQKLG